MLLIIGNKAKHKIPKDRYLKRRCNRHVSISIVCKRCLWSAYRA